MQQQLQQMQALEQFRQFQQFQRMMQQQKQKQQKHNKQQYLMPRASKSAAVLPLQQQSAAPSADTYPAATADAANSINNINNSATPNICNISSNHISRHQSHQPISILITQLRPIAIAVLADRESRARSPNIEPTRSDSRFCHLSTPGRLHHFFAMASLITSF
jgi:hypothetical protein